MTTVAGLIQADHVWCHDLIVSCFSPEVPPVEFVHKLDIRVLRNISFGLHWFSPVDQIQNI